MTDRQEVDHGGYGNVTLKKGVFVNDNRYWDWLSQIEMNVIKRVPVTACRGEGAPHSERISTGTLVAPPMVTKVRDPWKGRP